MRARSSNYLVVEAIIATVLLAAVFAVEWFYQAGLLAKGSALGLTALVMLLAAIAVIGLLIDLIVAGFRMKAKEKVNG